MHLCRSISKGTFLALLCLSLGASAGEKEDWAAAFQKRLDWWSLQPLRQTPPPAVKEAAWTREPVDRFVRAALEAAKLTPAAPAEPEVLLRRVVQVLTGLPPTPAQRERFLAEWQKDADAAYTRLLEQTLASPHFGEHFARHWMDAVRYTDTYGYEWDNPVKGSWEYRDYLIRAFNGDLGFGQFVTEQLAGDLLAEPRINHELGLNESLIGPVFYQLGEHRHGSSLMFNGIHQEMINNKIDAFSKVFLATTVACARCHDHKLEAVSQKDYYALAAVFMTPRWTSRVIDAPGKYDVAIAKLKALREQIRDELGRRWLDVATRPEAFSVADLEKALPAKATLDDVAYPMLQLKGGKTWTTTAAEWRTAQAQRQKAASGYQVLADFHEAKLPPGWVTEGDGMTHGYVEDGTPLIALEGKAAVARLLPRGYHTHALSSKLPGALRMPPEHTVPGKITSLRVAGGEFGGWLVMEGNTFQNETITFIDSKEPVWKSFADAALKNGVMQVTVEFSTSSLNPNFPPRAGLSKGLKWQDPGYEKRSWLSVTGITTHDQGGAPPEPLDHLTALYDEETPPAATAASWQRIRTWLTGCVQRWAKRQPHPGDVRVVQWLLEKQLLPDSGKYGGSLTQLVAEYRRIEAGISFPRTANSMDERETVKATYPLNIRGNVDAQGELVAPDSLQMFAGRNQVAASSGSGRLELARSLLDPEHPLTSRVYVNRVWQWLFGAGLVNTPDDFGRLGGKPSHPELLDYLARQFLREGGSTKALVRHALLSQTFRQSGAVSPAARERDPENRLLHHYPTRRLEAEGIRDALLAVAGRLDPKLYGPPINPPRSAEDGKKRLFSGPLDGHGRRSLYLQMSLMEPPKFLTGFNLPDLKLPAGKRDVTNVPGQALILMNDPLVRAMAERWAASLVKQKETNAAARIGTMFVQAFGRAPQTEELDRWETALKDFTTSGEVMQDTAAWAHLAHALFNAKEFIYYR